MTNTCDTSTRKVHQSAGIALHLIPLNDIELWTCIHARVHTNAGGCIHASTHTSIDVFTCIYDILIYFTTIYIHDWMHCTSAGYMPLQSFTFQAT